MAANLLKSATSWLLSPIRGSLPASVTIQPVRFRSHRHLPTRKRVNPHVQRHTDLIKKLSIALIMHERIQTTKGKAKHLKRYGNLLILATKRRQPPPDLHLLKNGFVLTEWDGKERLIKRRIVNRSVKNVLVEPPPLPEEVYVHKLRAQIELMLLKDQEAIDKLYGTLAERYKDRYGNFVKVTLIPNAKRSIFPEMAYVELVGNNLPALPDFPKIDAEGLHYLVYDTGKDAEVSEETGYESDSDDEDEDVDAADSDEEKDKKRGSF